MVKNATKRTTHSPIQAHWQYVHDSRKVEEERHTWSIALTEWASGLSVHLFTLKQFRGGNGSSPHENNCSFPKFRP